MSKKTKKHIKHSEHHRRFKRRYKHSHSIHHRSKTRKRSYKYNKRIEFSVVPGSKSVPIFSPPDKKKKELIPVNMRQSQGNIVVGLREYIKKVHIPL